MRAVELPEDIALSTFLDAIRQNAVSRASASLRSLSLCISLAGLGSAPFIESMSWKLQTNLLNYERRVFST